MPARAAGMERDGRPDGTARRALAPGVLALCLALGASDLGAADRRFAATLDQRGRDLPTSGTPGAERRVERPGGALTGTPGPDQLRGGGGATLTGLGGDDTYHVSDRRDRVVEGPDGGVDTVVSTAQQYRLPPHAENLFVARGHEHPYGRGNDGPNLIAAGDGDHTLDGAGGDDVLAGGGGADTFVVRRGGGSDVIADFAPGTDRVRLEDYRGLGRFERVRAAMRARGPDTVLDLGGGETLTFRGRAPGDFGPADFLLPLDREGLVATFADEFDRLEAGPAGGRTWRTTYFHGDRTLGNNKEAQYYSDRTVGVDPFTVEEGVLRITAAPGPNRGRDLPYNSGVISSHRLFTQRYGYFEMRARLPSGRGFWPAFWLLPEGGGWPPEIDVVEVLGHDPETMLGSVHTGANNRQEKAIHNVVAVPDVSEGFHLYGVEWQADWIRWYFDGNEIARIPTPAGFDVPMYVIANLAVGGPGSWPGPTEGRPTGHMLIDHIRVFRRPRGQAGGVPGGR